MENWSAFAPDFKELDENVEYEERESEFDVEDEDRSVDQAGESHDDEEVEVWIWVKFFVVFVSENDCIVEKNMRFCF